MSDSRSYSFESVALRLAQPLLIVATWCGVLALGMRYFFSPIGAVAEPTFGDLIGFGFGFTISGLVAASVALVVAGKRRWALEIALTAGVMIAALAAVAYLALWGAPWTLRSRMDAWSFLRLQQNVRHSDEAIENFYAPVGAGSGNRGWGNRGRVDRDRPPAAATGEIDRPGLARGLRDRGRSADPFRRGGRLGNGHQLAVLDWAYDPGTRVGDGHDFRWDQRGVRRVAGDPRGWTVAGR